MRCGEIQIGGNSFRKIRYFYMKICILLRKSLNLMFGGSRIMTLGSEGVYLGENCRTNPSRYLPGPKKPVKTKKNTDFRV